MYGDMYADLLSASFARQHVCPTTYKNKRTEKDVTFHTHFWVQVEQHIHK